MDTVYHKGTIKVLKSQKCAQKCVKGSTYSSQKSKHNYKIQGNETKRTGIINLPLLLFKMDFLKILTSVKEIMRGSIKQSWQKYATRAQYKLKSQPPKYCIKYTVKM